MSFIKITKVIILSGFGVNCEQETAFAFEICGAKTEILHITDLIEKPKKILDFQILVFPGGFSFGDHTGAGKSMANKIKFHLIEQIEKIKSKDYLILGICNGFQIMSQLGIFSKKQKIEFALAENQFPRYVCKWVELENKNKNCIFLRDIKKISLPIAHGEGRFFANEKSLEKIKSEKNITLTYIENPNGSIKNIAGICDSSGKIFGLMPHPERNIFFHHRPDFQKQKEIFIRAGKKIPKFSDGKKIFQNAIDYFK